MNSASAKKLKFKTNVYHAGQGHCMAKKKSTIKKCETMFFFASCERKKVQCLFVCMRCRLFSCKSFIVSQHTYVCAFLSQNCSGQLVMFCSYSQPHIDNMCEVKNSAHSPRNKYSYTGHIIVD